MTTGLKDVAAFFFTNGESTAQKAAEWKALTDEDKVQLATGIQNGTLTY